MPARGKVSILWQIVFVVFIPILDLWAFYRTKKLRKYLLYVYVPQIVVGLIVVVFFISMAFEENGMQKVTEFSDSLNENELLLTITSTVIGLGLTIFSIYLIATWSERWNKQFG